METYKMPRVVLGDMVWWRHDSASDPSAALVTAVSGECVDLLVFLPFFRGGSVQQAVHHVNHPDKDYPRVTETGVWEHRPQAMTEESATIPIPAKATRKAA